MEFETRSDKQTYELGRQTARRAKPGQVYALNGDLGVGKTVFAQGFAAGLGISEAVNSPTFTLIHEYEDGVIPFYHFDVYRITDPDEMEELGYEEYFYGDGVTMVEWASLVRELLPPDVITVTIEKDPAGGTDYRKIRVDGLPAEQDPPQSGR